MADRTAVIKRKTKETDIFVEINLDGSGKSKIDTGIPFLDHMLVLFAKHGVFDVTVKAKGDIEIDYHHTFEDIGICIGQALDKALGARKKIVRYGFSSLPMDEVLTKAEVSLDISGRPHLHFECDLDKVKPNKKTKIAFRRQTDIYFTKEFFKGLVNHSQMTLHIDVVRSGEIHHVNESIFKGFARALSAAVEVDQRRKGVSSTKGSV